MKNKAELIQNKNIHVEARKTEQPDLELIIIDRWGFYHETQKSEIMICKVNDLLR